MRREEEKLNTNSSAEKKKNTDVLDCPMCPPNKGCNSHRGHRKHGTKKPKYKSKRRGDNGI